MSNEHIALDSWLEVASPQERAVIYLNMFYSVMAYGNTYGSGEDIETPYGTIPDTRKMVPFLRFGMHDDPEAKAYMQQHPDEFPLPGGGSYALDYYRTMDAIVHKNQMIQDIENPTRAERVAAGEKPGDIGIDRQPQADGNKENPRLNVEYGAQLDDAVYSDNSPAEGYLPADQLRQDLQPYYPFERTLGFNPWPAVMGLAAVAGTAIFAPQTIPLMLSPLVRAASSWATYQAAHPMVAKTASGAHKLGWGLTAVASMNLATSVADASFNPDEVGALQDQMLTDAEEQLASNAAQLDDIVPMQVLRDEQWFAILGTGDPDAEMPEDFDVQTAAAETYVNAVGNVEASTEFPQILAAPEVVAEPGLVKGETAMTGFLGSANPNMADAQANYFNAATEPGDNIEAKPDAFIGENFAGSPIDGSQEYAYQPPPIDGQEQLPVTRWKRGDFGVQRNTFAQGIENATIGGAAVSAPMPATYDQGDFTRIVGNMTPGQSETFIMQAQMAGLISEDYIGTGFMDGTIASTMEQIMYQANLSGRTWQDALDLMVDAYQAAEEERKGDRLQEHYNNFVPSSPYVKLDYATIAQNVKGSMREQIGREANQWEVDMLADSMRSDHRARYDAQVQAERAVWNAQGRAQEYDEPQDGTLGEVQGVDEDSRFWEKFESEYATELDERERWQQVQQGTQGLFGGLSRMSDLMGGV